MARPRSPLQKAKVEGRDVKDRGRFSNRSEPSVNRPIGLPPKWMTREQGAVWREFADEIPWLNGSHRPLLEIATIIRTRIVAGEEVGVQALNLLRQCLGSMGATPSDATKVSVPQDDEKDEDDLLD